MAFSGNYHDKADILARFDSEATVAHLTGNEVTGVVDDVVLTEVAEGTEGEFDSYVGAKYKVPLAVGEKASLAALCKSVVLDMTVYHIHALKRVIPERVEETYLQRIAWLETIRDGENVLPTDRIEEGTETRAAPLIFSDTADPDDSNRRFTRAKTANV